jgi:hypothetical protein
MNEETELQLHADEKHADSDSSVWKQIADPVKGSQKFLIWVTPEFSGQFLYLKLL